MKTIPLSGDYLSTRILTAPDIEVVLLLRLLAYVCTLQRLLPLALQRCCAIAKANGRAASDSCELVLGTHFDMTELGRKPVEGMLVLAGPFRFSPAEDIAHASRIRNASVTTMVTGDAVTPMVTVGASPASRMQRYRNRQRELVNEARSMGISLSARTSVADIEQAIAECRIRNASVTHPSPPVTIASRVRADLPEYQYQYQQPKTGTARAQGVTIAAERSPTAAGAACLAMKAAGMAAVNPSHPQLLRLLSQGVSAGELADAAREAAERGKPFAYALAMVEGRRKEAAASTALPGPCATPSKDSILMQWAGPALAAKLRGEVT